MITKYFHIGLLLLIFAIVQIGFGEILPEEYPSRVTQTNMDETARLGAAISRGLYERCLVAKVDPLSFAVANKIGWYFDQSARSAVDTKIKALVPHYVDTNTVYNGTINITVLTVAGLFTELDIGDHASLFTGTPASGTNVATYGDYPFHVNNETLPERSKVICAQQKTKLDSYYSGMEKWHGHGFGDTYIEAYNAAVDSYDKVTGWSSSGEEIKQYCKITFFSNLVVQGGSGQTNETGANGALEYYSEGQEVYGVEELIVSAVIPGKITVASSDVSNLIYYSYVTNLNITGTLTPDAAGHYTFVSGDEYGMRTWEQDGGEAVFISDPDETWNNIYLGEGRWERWYGIEGSYSVYRPGLPEDPPVATGTPYVVFDIINNSTTNPAAPVDYSGVYYPITNNIWQGGAGYIFITNDLYTIYSSLTLGTNAAYLVGETLVGNYSAVNFTATTVVSEDSEGGPPCMGVYSGAHPSWSCGSWSCRYDAGADTYYITQDTNDPPSPAWSKGGEDPESTYSPTGDGIYGSVSAELSAVFVGPGEETKYPVYYPHNWIEGGVTNSVFYECWLTKIVATNDSESITNIEHSVGYWLMPTAPAYGTINYFDDQGLGLTTEAWNKEGEGDGTFATNSPVLIWEGVVDTPPFDTEEPTVPNESSCSGFSIDSKSAIVDWHFQYCTNKWW